LCERLPGLSIGRPDEECAERNQDADASDSESELNRMGSDSVDVTVDHRNDHGRRQAKTHESHQRGFPPIESLSRILVAPEAEDADHRHREIVEHLYFGARSHLRGWDFVRVFVLVLVPLGVPNQAQVGEHDQSVAPRQDSEPEDRVHEVDRLHCVRLLKSGNRLRCVLRPTVRIKNVIVRLEARPRVGLEWRTACNSLSTRAPDKIGEPSVEEYHFSLPKLSAATLIIIFIVALPSCKSASVSL